MTHLPRLIAILCAFSLELGASPAQALEFGGGVSLGGIVTGTRPRFAVSPHAGVSWHSANGFMLAAHEMCSVLPAGDRHGVGIYNQASVAPGYATENATFSIGPSFSAYSTPACNATICGRVVGLALGARFQANVYFAGPLGVSLSANADWITGSASAFLGSATAMIVAGPVLRWSPK